MRLLKHIGGFSIRTERAATASGAITAAASVLAGGMVAMLTGTVSASALLQAVPFAFVVGAAGGTVAWFAALGSSREVVADRDRVPPVVDARVSAVLDDAGFWPVRGLG